MSTALSALDDLRATLRIEMPITQHAGIEVSSYQDGCLTIRAPLAANVNHRGHAFAGSLNAVATLAGWGWLWLALREHAVPGHVVIQDSTVRYIRPVQTDFHARCGPAADVTALEKLLDAVRRRGVERITLDTVVDDRQGTAVTFSGRYVVQGGRLALAT